MAKYRFTLALAPIALLAAPAAMADWKFAPVFEARQTYTDNARLAPPGSEQGDWLTEISPGFALSNRGPRFRFDADYRLRYVTLPDYAGSDSDRLRSILASSLSAELAENLLYFDAAASISQESISAFGPLRGPNDYATSNQADVRTYNLSPYLRHRFGGTATAELRYTRDSVKADRNRLINSDGETASVLLSSGRNFDDLGWTFSAREQRVDYELAPESTSSTASLSLRQRLGRTLALTASAGYDSYDYQSLGGATEGRSWTAGAVWTPGTRTRVEANAGRRFYGDSYYLSANHRTRRTVWSLNYNDEVTSTRAQFLLPATIDTATMLDELFARTIPDPAARQQAVDAYMRNAGLPPSLAADINYFSNRYFLQKRFQASAAFRTARSNLVLSAFDTRRTALSQDTDAPQQPPGAVDLNDATRQTGASAILSWRLSARSAINASLAATRVESDTAAREATHRMARIGVMHQLGPRLNGAVELRRSSGPSANLREDYRENAVAASLTMLY
jgi:uncharacterized protein (PEP-CTERM system associated)